MKTFLLRLLSMTIILFYAKSDLDSQISVMQFRHVPSENVDEFVHRETTYWSQVAQKAVNDGKLISWSLWERIGGWKLSEKTANFVFVNTFADPEALDNMGSIWNPMSVFPNGRFNDMETESLSETLHMIITADEATVWNNIPFQYARVNFAKAKDLETYLELEKSVWMPFVKTFIEKGTSTIKFWSLLSVISPGGEMMPFNAITIDGFETMGGAFGSAFPEGTTLPSFDELEKVHSKEYIQLYRLVKTSVPKE
jgi:hypothetical protein